MNFVDRDNDIHNCSTNRKYLAWDNAENDDIGEETVAEYIGCIKDMYGFESFKHFTV